MGRLLRFCRFYRIFLHGWAAPDDETVVQTSATPCAAAGVRFARGDSPVKYFASLCVVMVIAAVGQKSAAQEVLSPPMEAGAGDLPPEMDLSDELPSGLEPEAGAETIEPIAEPYTEESMGQSFSTDYVGDPRIMATCPPLFESSGTWLRRGFWFAEADLMLMNSGWDRKGLLLAFEGNVGQSPGTAFGQVGFGPVLALNNLVIEGSAPGAQPMARVSLGRFLFRDGNNRDHIIQGTVLLGGQWDQASVIGAALPSGIQINDFIDRVNPSFDGAQQIGFNYATTMSGGEVDYVRQAAHAERPDGAAAQRRLGPARQSVDYVLVSYRHPRPEPDRTAQHQCRAEPRRADERRRRLQRSDKQQPPRHAARGLGGL